MKKSLFILIIALVPMFVGAQNLIGYSMDEVKRIIPKVRPGYAPDNFVTTSGKVKTLKYMDKAKDNTLMFFFDEKGKCAYSKYMLDVSLAKNAVDTLTKKYKYIDKLTWLDVRNGKDYVIKMENSEWYFTIIINEKE